MKPGEQVCRCGDDDFNSDLDYRGGWWPCKTPQLFCNDSYNTPDY